jgi:hypothetical protein
LDWNPNIHERRLGGKGDRVKQKKLGAGSQKSCLMPKICIFPLLACDSCAIGKAKTVFLGVGVGIGVALLKTDPDSDPDPES